MEVGRVGNSRVDRVGVRGEEVEELHSRAARRRIEERARAVPGGRDGGIETSNFLTERMFYRFEGVYH